MSINTNLVMGLNEITDQTAREEYIDSPLMQQIEEPMNNVVVRTTRIFPSKAVDFPFRKYPLPCLEFTYNLCGDTILSLQDGPGDWTNYRISGETRSIGYNTEFKGIARINSSCLIKNFHLYITPQKLAQLLGSGNSHLVGTIIDKAIIDSKRRLSVTDIDPIVTSIIHQIFARNDSSPSDSLFLKGKILELLSREVELLCTPLRNQTILQPDDVMKLQSARTIMMKQMSTPPSISELARKVGLNERKIKQGFKELFGSTVYSFLRDYRMEQAKLMFDRDQKSVTDVACAVGYSNISHFGVIFRQHYGIRPGDYLRSRRESRVLHLCHLQEYQPNL